MQIIEEVEALGGMTKAIESGMAKLRIEESATRKQVRCFCGLYLFYFICWCGSALL
jgi:methylmalonyl-CoA mutase